MNNMTWYSEDGYETDEDEKKSAITSLINGVPSIKSYYRICSRSLCVGLRNVQR